ncbi:unnamed protein product [Staurois parvus]|uniref:Uncharacterized protein n=1 Tax=Staurois parvus TaxID=386267 RepID=A0ABN9DGE1_9NEOB|nr:unnamed protein product [Staurois parvus]
MVRRYLGHMTDPRSRRTNHKAQVLLAHAHWAPGCHAERHYRSREDSARLDRGTGKIKQKLCGSKSGYLSNSGTRSPPPPQRSAVICKVPLQS